MLPDLREGILFRVSIFGYKAYFARQQGRGHDRFRRHGFRDAKRKFPRIFERFVADAARARVKQVRIECPLCARSGRCGKDYFDAKYLRNIFSNSEKTTVTLLGVISW